MNFGFEFLTAANMKCTLFQGMTPYSLVKILFSFFPFVLSGLLSGLYLKQVPHTRLALLTVGFLVVSSLIYPSILKIKAVRSSETLVNL
jgi:hypothetical protein